MVSVLAGCAPDPAKVAAARREVVAVTRTHLDAFERGDFDAWAGTFSRDGFLIAADPSESIEGAASMAAEMHREMDTALDQGLRLDIRSTDLQVGLAHNLKGAWVSDELAYVAYYGGDSLKFKLRFSGVLDKQDEVWRFEATNFSRGVSLLELAARADTGGIVTPAPVRHSDTGARDLERVVREAFADTSKLMRLMAKNESVQVMGPAPGQRASGPAVAPLLRDEFQSRGAFQLVDEQIRVRRRGSMGWAVANLTRSERPGWKTMNVPYRALLVFESCGEGCWRLVQAHFSNGTRDPE